MPKHYDTTRTRSFVIGRWAALGVAILFFVMDNFYPGMTFIHDNQTSPWGKKFLERQQISIPASLEHNFTLIQRRQGELNEREKAMGQRAWSYFEQNIDRTTGLVNTTDRYRVTDLWTTASLIAALQSAFLLDLIDKNEFDRKIELLLSSLQSLPLLDIGVPNRFYSTDGLTMVNYLRKEGSVGYSPLDMGRLLSWLHVLRENNSYLAHQLDRVALRWNYCSVVDQGQLYGGLYDSQKKLHINQQGRLGYEQYAAKGFKLWGFDTGTADRVDNARFIRVGSYEVPLDSRDFSRTVEKQFLTPDSFFLDGLEYGWRQFSLGYVAGDFYSDAFSLKTAQTLYLAQFGRFVETGMPTAKGEFQSDRSPYFVYDTVTANGYNWNTINEFGVSIPQMALINSRAIMMMWALWDTPYTDFLFDLIDPHYSELNGYYEGLFESGPVLKTTSANTNAIVLQSLAYKRYGLNIPKKTVTGLWEFTLKSALKNKANPQCLPLESVCEKNCGEIASFTTKGFATKQLESVQSKIEKLQNERSLKLKAFEVVQ